MSNKIDQQVVEMRFDSKQFENNVSSTMSSVEKLKQSLNFKGASKGFENISAAANSVDMSGMAKGVETVRMKFSALEVMGVTALTNITNQAVNAGKRIASALTIDPVKTGFQEYETQINAVQTILANTQSKGTTIDHVNAALEELNKYADQTIYNFTEMTRNIGTFTAAGVDLETAVQSIKGIANLAAVSGASSQQASTAMYQLSQAMSSGSVKLMDWNSVVNASMGGQVFQDALKETARVHGIAIDAMIESEGSFRETLKDGWLTTEILNETLEKFTQTTEGLTEEEIKANRERWKSLGYTDEQIDGIFQLGKTATDAATKVKTFTQLFDVLKEAAQSGWAQTWKIIFGDFEEAKAVFTPLATFLTNIINGFSDARNALLEGALGRGFKGISDIISGISKPLDALSETVSVLKDYDAVVTRIIRGDYGNMEKRWNKLTEEGYDWAHAQNLVNERLGCSFRYTTDYTDAQNKASDAQSQLNETTSENAKLNSELIMSLIAMSDAQLRSAGYSDEQIAALRDIEKYSKKTGIPLKEFIERLDEINGRTLLLGAFQNAGKGIVTVCKAIRDAWLNAFPPMSSERLFDLIADLHKFSTYLIVGEETANELTRTLKGLFAILDIVLTIIGGPFKVAIKILARVLGEFDLNILSVTASIGDVIVAFRDFLFENNIVVKGIEAFIIAIHRLVSAFFKLKFVQDAISTIKNAFSGMFEVGSNIIVGLINGIQDGSIKVVEVMANLGRKILDTIKKILNIQSPSKEMFKIGQYIVEGLINGIGSLLGGLWNLLTGIVSKIKDIVGELDLGAIITIGAGAGVITMLVKIGGAIEALTDPLEGTGEVLQSFSQVLKATKGAIKSFSAGLKAKALKDIAIAIAILAASVAVLSLLNQGKVWSATTALVVLAGALYALSALMSKLDIGGTKGALKLIGMIVSIGMSMLLLSASLAIMTKVIKQLGSMETTPALKGIVALIAIITSLAFFAKIVKSATGDLKKMGGTLLLLSASLLILVGVIKLISKLEIGELIKGGITIAALMAFLALFLIFASPTIFNNLKKVGSTLFLLSTSILLLVFAIKLMSKLEPDELTKGALTIGSLMVFMGIFMKLARGNFLSDLKKVGSTLLALSVSLLLLIAAIKLIRKLSIEEVLAGGAFIVSFMLFMGNFVKLVGYEKDLKGVASTLIMLSVSLLILTGAIALLGFLNPEHLIKGELALAGLAVILGGLIWVTKFSKDCHKNLLYLSVAIGVLTASVALLSLIDPKKLIAPVAAMTILMGMFSLVIKATNRAKKAWKSLAVLTASIGLIAVAIYVLAKVPADRAIAAATSLSLVLGAMAASLLILKRVGNDAKSALSGVLALTAMAVPLMAFVGVLAVASNVKIAEKNVLALTLFAAAMSALLTILKFVGNGATNALLGVLSLTTMAVPLLAFIGILAIMQNIKDADKNVKALVVLATAMTVLLTVLTLVGMLITASGGLALLGVVGLLAMAVPLLAFVGILAIMQNIQNAEASAMLLIALMTSVTTMLIKLSLIAPLLVVGTAAILGLTAAMGLIGGLLIAAGALSQIPGLSWLIDKGTEILGKVGYALGNFIGSIIGGIGAGISSGLPAIAENLTKFMNGIGGFIEGAKSIDQGIIDKIKTLSEAIAIITEASVLEGIQNGNENGSALVGFVEILNGFAAGFIAFSNSLSGLDESSVQKTALVADALKKLVEISTGIPNSGGVVGFFAGENDLDTFGQKLKAFALEFVEYSKNISGLDESVVQKSTWLYESMKMLNEIANGIPNSGGMLAWFAGENDIVTFGQKIKAFAWDFVEYSKNISGLDESVVQKSTWLYESMKMLNEIATGIPNSGGMVSWFAGENDIVTFGQKLKAFGWDFKEYSKNISDLDGGVVSKTDMIYQAMGKLTEIAKTLPQEGGIFQFFKGDQDLGAFGSKLTYFGWCFGEYARNIANVDGAKVNSATHELWEFFHFAKALQQSKYKDDQIGQLSSALYGIGPAISNFGYFTSGFNGSSANSAIHELWEFFHFVNELKNSGYTDAGAGMLASALYKIGPAVDNYNWFTQNVTNEKLNALTQGLKELYQFLNGMSGFNDTGVVAFTDSLKSFNDIDINSITAFIDSITQNIQEDSDSFRKAGEQLVTQLIDGIKLKENSATTAFVSLSKSMVAAVTKSKNSFRNVGKYMVEGIAKGVKDNTHILTKAIRKLVNKTLLAAQDEAKIQSPSVVFNKEVGRYIVQGIAEGITDDMSAEEAAKKKVQNIKDAFQAEITKLDLLDTDLDLRIKLGWATDDGSSLERQKERVKLAKSEYEETVKYSTDTTAIREAHNKYLQEEVDLLDMINSKTSENFQKNMAWIEERGQDNKASLEEQLRYWKRMSAMYKEGSVPYETIMKKVKELQETLDGSMTYNEELNEYLYLMTQCAEGTDEWAEAAEKVAGAMEKINNSDYENSLKWIENQKENNKEFSLFDELAAWKRVQNKWTGIDDEKAEEAGDNVKRVLGEITDAHEEYAKAVEDLEADLAEKRSELNKEYYDKCEERNEQLEQDIADLEQKYNDALESRRSSIYGSYGLFDKAKPNKYVSGQALIENLQSQVDQLDIWRNDLNALTSRGIDDALIEELREMGPSSAAQIEALNKLSDEELDQYVQLWQDKHALAKEQATFELEKMRSETDAQIEQLKKDTEDDLKEYEDVWLDAIDELEIGCQNELIELKNTWLKNLGMLREDSTTEFTKIVNEGVEAIGNKEKWTEAGANIIEGIIKGISDETSRLYSVIEDVAKNTMSEYTTPLDMNSPSRKFMEFGRYIDEGLIIGINSLKNDVSKSSEGLGLATIDSFSSTIAKINDLVAENIDIQPTIRPVLDLTNVREGFRGIDGMFARNQAMSISSGMNRDSSENQNGDSSKSSGNTYTFTQNNYSPKALSRLDIYRQTKNQFSAMKGLVET